LVLSFVISQYTENIMSDSINLLVKIFSKQEHINEFLDGNLYISSLKKFVEMQGNNTQADLLEGITGQYQPHDIIITIKQSELGINHTIPPEDYSAPIYTSSNGDLGKLKALCFFSPLIKMNNFENIKDDIRITDKMRKDFGEDVVLIHKPQEFINRVLETAKKEKISCKTKHINYFPESETIDFDSQNFGFNKRQLFDFQKEFRIMFSTTESNNHMRLNIGDIRNLCVVLNVDQFNEELEFKIETI
jgi:hypothetical protein